ncbi:diphthine--ammonia ligase [Candidatus Nitrosocosmicus franklandus]|uniref:ATP-binding region n=1 Tax=Candidatus Nitrosocosmicus franklandianus TaxID=1798806 RepID=A0A484IHE9_9ARCH|nr:diphthine--ammonia ligase [Candidatus Nitrosocosmicus franklandus]VFJ15442.1 ATP-binding region [Candidatus Nitrosocosmicus franklandus]
MNFAALFSGGKDSTFAISELVRQGHNLTCLIVMQPANDESMLFHYPCTKILRKITKVFDVPVVQLQCSSPDKDSEYEQLQRAIAIASSSYPITAISNGCISSKFQYDIIHKICREINLTVLSPIWQIESDFYFNQLLDQGFEIIITRVAASGLDKSWLGKTIDRSNYLKLKKLSEKFGFNLTFEGGEAETLVLNSPIYKKKVVVKQSTVEWDGLRGIFEIAEVDLIEK